MPLVQYFGQTVRAFGANGKLEFAFKGHRGRADHPVKLNSCCIRDNAVNQIGAGLLCRIFTRNLPRKPIREVYALIGAALNSEVFPFDFSLASDAEVDLRVRHFNFAGCGVDNNSFCHTFSSLSNTAM